MLDHRYQVVGSAQLVQVAGSILVTYQKLPVIRWILASNDNLVL